MTESKAIHITELLTAVIVAIAGIFLLLVGVNAIAIDIKKCWLITVFATLLAVSIAVTVVERNRIGAFFTGVFIVLVVSEALVLCGLKYSQVYPIYITALPIGCVLALIKTVYFFKSFLAACAATGGAAILFISSLGGVSLAIVLPTLAIYLGILGAIYALYKLIQRKNKKL